MEIFNQENKTVSIEKTSDYLDENRSFSIINIESMNLAMNLLTNQLKSKNLSYRTSYLSKIIYDFLKSSILFTIFEIILSCISASLLNLHGDEVLFGASLAGVLSFLIVKFVFYPSVDYYIIYKPMLRMIEVIKS